MIQKLFSIDTAFDKGYIVAGYVISSNDTDAFVMKLDTTFEQDWRKNIGNTGLESFNDIVTTDFSYIAVGRCNTRGEEYEDMYVVHIDSFGDTILHETFGGDSVDYGYAVARFQGMPLVYFAGYNSSYVGNDFNEVEDLYLDQHENIYDNPPAGFDYISNVNVTAMAWFKYDCVSDKTGFLDKSLNICRAFSNPIEIINPTTIEPAISTSPFYFVMFPNPNNGLLTINSNKTIIKILIFDLLGKLQIEKTPSSKSVILDIDQLSNGVYLVSAYSDNDDVTNKIIVNK